YLAKVMATDALKSTNAVALHTYRRNKPENLANDLLPFNELRAQHGVTAPLWITEWGYSSWEFVNNAALGDGHSTDARVQTGKLILRQVLTQVALNIQKMVLYDLVDDCLDPEDKECNFGLLIQIPETRPAQFQLKPGMIALQNFRKFTTNMTYK